MTTRTLSRLASPFSEGRAYVDMIFEDPNGNRNTSDVTTRSILVDAQRPPAR